MHLFSQEFVGWLLVWLVGRLVAYFILYSSEAGGFFVLSFGWYKFYQLYDVLVCRIAFFVLSPMANVCVYVWRSLCGRYSLTMAWSCTSAADLAPAHCRSSGLRLRV